MGELTTLLAAARKGDSLAASQAFSLLYEDLRRLAQDFLHRLRRNAHQRDELPL